MTVLLFREMFVYNSNVIIGVFSVSLQVILYDKLRRVTVLIQPLCSCKQQQHIYPQTLNIDNNNQKMWYKNMCVTLITYTSEEWPCFGVLVSNAPWCSGKCKKSKTQPSVHWQIVEFQRTNTEIHLVLYKSRWKRASVCLEVRDRWLHRTNA